MREGEASCQVVPEGRHRIHLIQRIKEETTVAVQCCGVGIVLVPIRIRILPQKNFSSKILFYFTFIHSKACLIFLNLFYLSHQWHNFQYFGQHIEIFWKRV
jgi:hypothetical protein